MKIWIIGLIVLMIAITGCSTSDGQTINVQGSYELEFEPDEAEVWAGVSIVKLTAEEAQTEVNTIIDDMVEGLTNAGITKEDMSTERVSIYEERRWEEGKSSVVGWRATQTLKIKTTDLTKVGPIVDIAVESGANQLNNIQFKLSEEKEKEYKKEALSKATINAKEKAEVIAESLDVKLDGVKSVSESNFGYRTFEYMMEAKVASDMVEEAANIMPSDVSVSASINVVYPFLDN